MDLAVEFDVPVVATNQVRFLRGEDFEAHEARVCIQEGRTLDDPRRVRRYSDQQYLRSPREMAELFSDLPEALENSVEIARRCNLELSLGQDHLPDFPVPAGTTPQECLRRQAEAGLESRLEEGCGGPTESAPYRTLAWRWSSKSSSAWASPATFSSSPISPAGLARTGCRSDPVEDRGRGPWWDTRWASPTSIR